MDDATKVALADGRVMQIDKSLESWQAADTGVFPCPPVLFDALRQAAAAGRHSLADGVGELTAAGHLATTDVTGKAWLDVDTPQAYQEGRRRLLASLNKRNEDGYISTYLNRPISTRMSAFLAETPITPNQVTVVSFLISLLGAGLFAVSQHITWVMGAIILQLASIIDGCDGDIARLKYLATPFGAWLDTILDRYSDAAVVLAVTYTYATASPGPFAWIAGLFALCGFLLASYVTKERTIRYGRPYPNDVLNRLNRRDLRLLVVCLGAVIADPFQAMLAVGALSHLCIAGVLTKGWVMTRRSNNLPLR